jgi:elongation factor P
MPKASDLRKGDVVEIEGVPHVVKHLESKSPSSRGASTLYKVRFYNLITSQKRDESLRGNDMFPEADFQRVQVQFSYMDGDLYVFMNSDDYSQYTLDAEMLEGQLEYLIDGLEGLTALLINDSVVAIDLPQSVTMEIIETAPAIKGASASARTKPATTVTGLVVQVPEYIDQGDSIKINTTDGKYMARA